MNFVLEFTISANSDLQVCSAQYYHMAGSTTRTGTAVQTAVPVRCLMNTDR